MMIKRCAICDAEFDALGSEVTCSHECRRARKNAMNRMRDRSAERARYRAKHRDKLIAYKKDYRLRKREEWERANPEIVEARKEVDAAVAARAFRSCVVCGGVFLAKNNMKTCSEECWMERHRSLRGRPERRLTMSERLEAKRAAAQKLNDERRAAHQLIREIEAKGLDALL